MSCPGLLDLQGWSSLAEQSPYDPAEGPGEAAGVHSLLGTGGPSWGCPVVLGLPLLPRSEGCGNCQLGDGLVPNTEAVLGLAEGPHERQGQNPAAHCCSSHMRVILTIIFTTDDALTSVTPAP